MIKRRHPELEGYESHTLYTIELKRHGQTRRDRIAWTLFGLSVGLGLAIGGYALAQLPGDWAWLSSEVSSDPPAADSFRQGTVEAMNAAELTQSAESSEEWIQVAILWEQAITQMRSTPQAHPNHALAQEKIAEYERNLKYAQSNVSTRAAANPDQPVHWTIGSDRARVISVQGVPTQIIRYEHSCQETLRYGNSIVELKNGYVRKYDNFDNNLKVIAGDQTVLSTQPQDNGSWSLGASEAELFRVQGTPTQTSEYTAGEISTFYYGDSSVTLENGRVVSYFNVDRNLKVSLQPVMPASQASNLPWSLGSSRSEVLLAQQATPTHVSRNDSLCEEVFHFDDSEVSFSQGIVSGYKNVSKNLQVR